MSFVERVDYFTAVTSTDLAGVTTVTLNGTLDLSVALELRRVLREAWNQNPTRVRVDVSDVSFCDSAGIAQLYIAHEMCAQKETPFAVVGASPALRRIFELADVGYMLA